jgi:predicted flap endonuclease-1-like 5' DNA nuclease
MNDTSASVPGSSLLPDGIGAITAVHFVLMAIVAVAAIAMIVAGIRRKRQRIEAERQVGVRAEDAGLPSAPVEEAVVAEVPPPPPAPARVVETPRPAPVVGQKPAAPPPLADEPATPTPLADEPIAAAAPLDATPASVAADVPAAEERVPEARIEDAGSAGVPVADAPIGAAAAAPVAAVPLGSPADGPITQLKGLGPKLAERLATLGVTTVGQLAAMSDDEAAALDAQLGPFAGRMARDRWIEQARFLAAGDRAGFEAVFGRL